MGAEMPEEKSLYNKQPKDRINIQTATNYFTLSQISICYRGHKALVLQGTAAGQSLVSAASEGPFVHFGVMHCAKLRAFSPLCLIFSIWVSKVNMMEAYKVVRLSRIPDVLLAHGTDPSCISGHTSDIMLHFLHGERILLWEIQIWNFSKSEPIEKNRTLSLDSCSMPPYRNST